MCDATWDGLARPGAGFTGTERIAIARRARAGRLGRTQPDDTLAPALTEVVGTLAATPAVTSQPWVEDAVEALGEVQYLEVVGIVARVVAVDTFTRVVGVDPQSFPEPIGGDPTPVERSPKARKGRAWVNMVGFPVPPHVLSLVPPEMDATSATAEALYMTGAQMEDPDTSIDGLHRTQIETVATTLSHRNECFY